MSEPNPDKPKLIIDEDWKTQVEREREELKRKQDDSSSEPLASSSSTPSDQLTSDADNSESDDALPPPPPATFPFLISMLGTQALAAMGQLGDGPGAPKPRLDYAKHYIDLLGVLEAKTLGNRTPEEADLLNDWLHQLRMTYVQVAKHQH